MTDIKAIFLMLLLVFSPISALAQATAQATPTKPTLEEERLKLIKEDIRKEVDRYNKVRDDMDDFNRKIEFAKADRLIKTAQVYEKMPEEEAARALEKLDEHYVASILVNLKPKNAGKVLAKMLPGKAASISKVMMLQKNGKATDSKK